MRAPLQSWEVAIQTHIKPGANEKATLTCALAGLMCPAISQSEFQMLSPHACLIKQEAGLASDWIALSTMGFMTLWIPIMGISCAVY